MTATLTRRRLLIGGFIAAGTGALIVRHALRPAVSGNLVTPAEAHDMALQGRAVLVDIRRPDEWARSGVGEGAHPLDLRRDDFEPRLLELLGGDRNRPVILICAGGVRSRILSARLALAGFSHVIDVPEGMLGSRVGPGWVRRGLPTIPYSTKG